MKRQKHPQRPRPGNSAGAGVMEQYARIRGKPKGWLHF